MTIVPKVRPKILAGRTHKVETGCGNIYVTVNSQSGEIFEVFATMGKSGQCGAAQSEAICRLISICLRSGIDIEAPIKQMSGIRCSSRGLDEGIEVLSCADGIALAIKTELELLKKEK